MNTQQILEMIQKILSLGSQHQYLAIAILVIGWLTVVTGDKSKLEKLNIPSRWQPAVVGGLGVAYGILDSIQNKHVGVWPAIETGFVAAAFTGYLYDLVVKAYFGGPQNLPKWLKWLSLLPHQSTGNSNPPAAKKDGDA